MGYELKRLVVPFSCKQATQAGEFEGYGSIYGNVDLGEDVVVAGAFEEDLKEWKQRGQLPMCPWFHNMANPVGEYLEMREDSQGLWAKGMLWVPNNALGRDPIEDSKKVRNLLVSNGPKGMSIGYITLKESYGEQDGRRVRFLEKLKLMELSIVPFGMNPEALITSAKNLFSQGVPGKKEIESALRDVGFSQRQAKAFLAEGYKAISQDRRDGENGEEQVDSEIVRMLAELNARI